MTNIKPNPIMVIISVIVKILKNYQDKIIEIRKKPKKEL